MNYRDQEHEQDQDQEAAGSCSASHGFLSNYSRCSQFFVRMNGKPWPSDGRPISLTKVFTALRKAVVKSMTESSLAEHCVAPESDSRRADFR
jgi:hypothetical protein